MSLDADALWATLPAIHRIRDAESGGALRALIEVLAREAELVERDVDRLYDGWFVETCEEWLVPYIGDLLAVKGLHRVSPQTFSQRAWVANTIGHRRRKGTATMLEQLARDVTGWPARAVEFFERLAVSQHANHPRLHAPATLSLRDGSAAELAHGPFESAAHTLEVRNVALRRGRYAIPNVGLFLWRLGAYPLGRDPDAPGGLPADYATPRAVTDPPDGRYTFSPLGFSGPLFNAPRTEANLSTLAGEANVPGPLRRRALHAELEAERQAMADGDPAPPRTWFDPANPVLRVLWQPPGGSGLVEIPPARIAICHLADPPPPDAPPADWHRPPATRSYARRAGGTVALPIDVSLDPQSGRLAFAAGVVPQRVFVTFRYGFPADIGGGPYDRSASIPAAFGAPDWQVGVSRVAVPKGSETIFTRLADAVAAWNAKPAGTTGVIVLMDSTSEIEDGSSPVAPIRIPERSKLLIVGADWPAEPVAGSPGVFERRLGRFRADETRPHFAGQLEVEGAAPAASPDPGTLVVNGLLLEGSITVKGAAADSGGNPVSGHLGALALHHSTLVPGAGGLAVEGDNPRLAVEVAWSVVAGLAIAGPAPSLSVRDSIVDARGGVAIDAPQQQLDLERVTVIGSATAKTLSISNSIATAPVVAARRQTGCARFSCLAEGSRTPRRFRCQPDLALAAAAAAKGTDLTAAEADAIEGRLVPEFESLDYGHAAYAQLASTSALPIRTGAEDGSEMGAYSFLQQPQRESNLRQSLAEYLRVGLEAGFFFVT